MWWVAFVVFFGNARGGSSSRLSFGYGREIGLRDTVCTDCVAPFAIRGLRNLVQKIIGEPCAGKPHALFEGRMGNRARVGTAPLTTNV
jgi:hypothetical protein